MRKFLDKLEFIVLKGMECNSYEQYTAKKIIFTCLKKKTLIKQSLQP